MEKRKQTKAVVIRMTPEAWEVIEKEAEKEGRSVTNYITFHVLEMVKGLQGQAGKGKRG